jgi:hypothetical protein
VSVVDPFSARHYRDAGVAIRPFRPAIHFELHLCFPLGQTRSHLTEAMAEEIRRSVKGDSLPI